MNAIIILNYNNWKETANYVNTIKEYSALDYIVVVDNCSPDNSYNHLIELQSDHIHVVKSLENGGYNKGNNLGVRYAIDRLGATKVIISNPDIEVSNECISQLIKDLDSGIVDLVAPLVYNPLGVIQSNCGWNLPSYWQSIMNSCLITYKIQKLMGKSNYFSAIDYPDDMIPVEAVSGCFFGMTKAAYEAIGGFDEDNFLYGEEVLLGAALKKHGYKSIIDKKCSLIHMDQGSKKESFEKWRRHSKLVRDAHILYLIKWISCGRIGIVFYNVFAIVGQYTNRVVSKIFF